MKKLFLFLSAFFFASIMFIQIAQAELPFVTQKNPWRGQDYAPGELIIKFKDNVPETRRDQILSRLRMKRMAIHEKIGAIRYRLPRLGRLKEIIEECKKDENIDYVEPNYFVYTHFTPNDQYFSYQWNFDNPGTGGINMKEAWNTSTGNSNAVVAIVDTGIAYENYSDPKTGEYYRAPDLAQTSFVPGYDFTNNDSHPNDDNGHGTHVAGVVAQSTDNGLGVAGIAFNASLMPIKVLDEDGAGTSFDVADGITWATDNGADVINLSIGSNGASTTIRRACEYAHDNGVTVVCSTGNDGDNQLSYPAFYDQCCIAVGATRYDETKTFYSNFGTGLDLVAPGGDASVDQNFDGVGDGILQQTFANGNRGDFQYWLYNGTSMAAPHVSGVAALLIASGVATTPQEVRAALQNTAKDLGAPGWDPEYGWGLIDAAAALKYNGGSSPSPVPLPNVAPIADPGGPYSGASRTSIAFDGSGSSDENNDQLTYSWNFGDNRTGSGVNPTHSYFNDGTYIVTLRVSDGQFESVPVSTTATVTTPNEKPVANPGGPYSAKVGESIRFNGTQSRDSDGSISLYSWNFGDGNFETGSRPFHTYAAAGNYTVSLEVTDNQGAKHTQSTQATITQDTPAPTPTPTPDPTPSPNPPSNNVLFSDGFEDGEWNGKWTEDSQNDWRRSRIKRLTDRYSAEVDGRTTEGSLTSQAINLQGNRNVTVSFHWYIDRWLDSGEYLAFDVSTNNGSTWTEQRVIRPESSATEKWLPVSVQLNNINSLRLRFRGTMSSGGEDAYVDDVTVTAN